MDILPLGGFVLYYAPAMERAMDTKVSKNSRVGVCGSVSGPSMCGALILSAGKKISQKFSCAVFLRPHWAPQYMWAGQAVAEQMTGQSQLTTAPCGASGLQPSCCGECGYFPLRSWQHVRLQ